MAEGGAVEKTLGKDTGRGRAGVRRRVAGYRVKGQTHWLPSPQKTFELVLILGRGDSGAIFADTGQHQQALVDNRSSVLS